MSQVSYKESGVRWLGRVPVDWGVTKIKRHCAVKRGASPRPIDDQKYFSDTGEYAWVRISDVTASDKYLLTSDQRLSELGASLSVKREPGDIFVSICASVGKPVITRIKCCIHDGFVWFDQLKLEPEYLFYLFMSGEMFKGLGNWGTQLNLNTDIIAEIEIPIPTPDEQTAKIDRLMDMRRRQMALLKEQREALIQQAVTRGLNPNVPMKDSGLPWLGEIPAHWEVSKIKHHCIVKRGASPRPIDDPKYFDDNGEYSWVRISDVTASDKYLTTSKQQLSALGASLSVKREPGDIFVSICASVGKPIITQIKCCIHDGFVWFDRLKLEPEYLFQLFTNGEMFKGLGNWGTQLNLNTDIIGDIKIPVPPASEQRRIAEHLDEGAVEFDRIHAAYTRQLELLTEYRAALIHECVTGQRMVTGVVAAGADSGFSPCSTRTATIS